MKRSELRKLIKEELKYINEGIEDIKKITKLIKVANKYVLAQFRPLNTLNPDWGKVEPYSISVLNEMKKIVQDAGINCEIRAGY